MLPAGSARRPIGKRPWRPAILGAWLVCAAAPAAAPIVFGAPAASPVASPEPSPVTVATPEPATDVARAICGSLGSARDRALGEVTTAERRQLVALYSDGCAPLWVSAAGRPNPDAGEAIGLLAGVAGDGLDPASYGAPVLVQWAQQLGAAPSPATADVAAFDVAMSAGTLRYLRQLHGGRVDPRAIGFRMTSPADNQHDLPVVLRAALRDHRLRETVATFTPPLALYRALRGVLPRYRALAADATLVAPPATRASVHAGEPYEGVLALRRLLLALGDLPADAPPPPPATAEAPALGGLPADVPAPPPATPDASSLYDGALVEGVKRFQVRHGLEPDGVLGAATLAALRVPLAWRARQIELALERLRWAPHLDPERFLAVNIPMYRLWVWSGVPVNGAPRFGMDVIVGRALDQQTPVFVEEMRYVVFRPYWNVPPSIARGEIVPAIRREAGYLQRQQMEYVAGQGDDSPAVAATEDSLAQLKRGKLRVRQRPGPRNALGLVKFVFPNDDNVYLHHTPAPQLFSKARRDFSHGCVRVEDPVGLAEWVLEQEEGWTRERIEAAMQQGPPSQRVSLARPIQVILFYLTAVVMPEDGAVHFAEDIYRHDEKLDAALRRLRPAAATGAARAAGHD